MKVNYLFFFNHLLSNMFRQYVKSHHQAFLNKSLKIIKDIKSYNIKDYYLKKTFKVLSKHVA